MNAGQKLGIFSSIAVQPNFCLQANFHQQYMVCQPPIYLTWRQSAKDESYRWVMISLDNYKLAV